MLSCLQGRFEEVSAFGSLGVGTALVRSGYGAGTVLIEGDVKFIENSGVVLVLLSVQVLWDDVVCAGCVGASGDVFVFSA